MDKSTVININESVTETTGKSLEQLILRILVLYLFGEQHLVGMI
jgi:hypothetical protein